MKSYRIVLLLLAAGILFGAGLFIRPRYEPAKSFLLIAGTITGFIFYVITFYKMLHSTCISPQEKIFWLVAIVCVPVIGNLLFVIIQTSISSSSYRKRTVPV